MRKLFLILSIGILSSSAQADGVMESLKSLISRKPKVDVCAVSYNQTNVDTAIEQVEQAMNDKKCVAKFAEYVELVLNTAAENDPGKQNYDKVGKMVTNQMKQGRIGRVHASNIVQSYFKRNIVTFSELKKVRMDTVACERNVNGDLALSSELASKAKEELRKKELGILKALDDPKGYREAQDFHDMMIVQLEGACVAKGLVGSR